MDCFKSTCPQCKNTIYWTGSSTRFVVPVYPTCETCGTKTTGANQKIDRESVSAKEYAERLMVVLSKWSSYVQDDS